MEGRGLCSHLVGVLVCAGLNSMELRSCHMLESMGTLKQTSIFSLVYSGVKKNNSIGPVTNFYFVPNNRAKLDAVSLDDNYRSNYSVR